MVMANSGRALKIKDLNHLISCRLCHGYLIDATTIVECLHSFCKTCILKHLDSDATEPRCCPVCKTQIHKTRPKKNIRSDPTLQDIVYKLVPGLFKNEMNRRREFFSKEKPESAVGLSNEERGQLSGERLIFTPDDVISLSIEYFPQVITYSLLPFSKKLSEGAFDTSEPNQRRYLRCQGGMRVLHLKKWLKLKYNVKDSYDIEIMYKHDPLADDYTMMDLAYIYSWRRNGPLCLYYKINQPNQRKEESNKLPSQISSKRKPKNKGKPAKKKRNDYEANLITTNPVNEPLPPLVTDPLATNSLVTKPVDKKPLVTSSVVAGQPNVKKELIKETKNKKMNGDGVANVPIVNGNNKKKKSCRDVGKTTKAVKTGEPKVKKKKRKKLDKISNGATNGNGLSTQKLTAKNNINGHAKSQVTIENKCKTGAQPNDVESMKMKQPFNNCHPLPLISGASKNGLSESFIEMVEMTNLLSKNSSIPLLPAPRPFKLTSPLSNLMPLATSNCFNGDAVDDEVALNLCTSSKSRTETPAETT